MITARRVLWSLTALELTMLAACVPGVIHGNELSVIAVIACAVAAIECFVLGLLAD